MELHLLELLSEYGYFGMFLLIMIENIFPPIPSEAVLSFGGFLTEHTELNLQGMLIAATAGSLAGAVILYWGREDYTTESAGSCSVKQMDQESRLQRRRHQKDTEMV